MSLNDYVMAFQQLRTDAGATKYPACTLNRAPHKPILLLCVLDLAEQGNLSTNFVPLSTDLGDLFRSYWNLVMPSDRYANLALPFFHLKSNGFWHLIPQQGKGDALSKIRQIAGMAQLRRTVVGAQLDTDLYGAICVSESRKILRTTLINQYFHQDYHAALNEQAIINLGSFNYSQILLDHLQFDSLSAPTDISTVKPQIRDQGFRRAIVMAYDHRCVLCGVRLVTDDGHTAAEAAHIVPWSVSHNDNPRNGLCLCRMCHWVFDIGMAGITDQSRVKLSRQVHNTANIAGHLSTIDGRPIFEPIDVLYNPFAESLLWHMENVFLH